MNISVFVLMVCLIGVHADVQPQRDFNLQRVRNTQKHTHTLCRYILILRIEVAS